jgi:hypothetical protein
VDGSRPNHWDLDGATLCLISAGVAFFALRLSQAKSNCRLQVADVMQND